MSTFNRLDPYVLVVLDEGDPRGSGIDDILARLARYDRLRPTNELVRHALTRLMLVGYVEMRVDRYRIVRHQLGLTAKSGKLTPQEAHRLLNVLLS